MARSDNWRINKSALMAVEGAQILKSLQKVAGAAGLPKGYQVRFATKGKLSGIDFDKKDIVIGAGRIFNEAPIPADLFDVLVGLTLHEVGHHVARTDQVNQHYENSRRMGSRVLIPDSEADLFRKFINIGEDVVVESQTRANKNLAEYDQILHDWAVSQMHDADPYKLLEVWIEYALGHKSTTVLDLPPELDEPMQQLVALTGWLRTYHGHYPIDRFDAYCRYWKTVKELVLNPPKPPEPEPEPQQEPQNEEPQQGEPSEDGEKSDQQKQESEPEKSEEPSAETPEESEPEPQEDETEDSEKDGEDSETGIDTEGDTTQEPEAETSENGTDSDGTESDIDEDMDIPLAQSDEDSIDEELAKEIDEAIESETEDVTEEVWKEFGEQLDSATRSYPVIRSRETKAPLIKPDMSLRKRLERIMTIRKRLQTRIMRGEQYGRIDKRHLNRIATDERIFNLRYKFPDGFPETRILIDLSGSMSGWEADEVLQAAGALQTLVNAEVWCYNASHNGVNLVRMDEGRLIHQFQPGGGTPSGLAIVGVAIGLKKNGLVIHLTDGGHNGGQTPWTAHWILQKKGIDLVNLIWSNDTRHYALDGMKHQKLRGLTEFPDALYRILVEQSNLKTIGGR